MTKTTFCILPLALLAAMPAMAGETLRNGQPGEPEFGEKSGPPSLFKTSFSGDYTGFSDDRGSRRLITGEFVRDTGPTSFILGFSQGRRDFGKGKKSYDGIRVTASVGHDWSNRISTVTTIAASDDSPVFEQFRAQQDVDVKVVGGTVLRLGGRYSRFRGGVDVSAATAGITQYLGGGFLSYRLSAFDTRGRGTSFAHLASFKIKDPRGKGSTQLWAGTGSSLHESDWEPDVQKGRATSLSLKRSQPISRHVSLSVSVGRTWYDRPLGDYQGTRFGFGLAYNR
ncbi:YaiO family outer membrane beta-barrel protein [Sphingomonas sp. LHG3406-1]|uniref:YaiO family outer membrane beta-barrel protein n=1 Tax=Sphingomonas sp. LHG3406-1 TaxID=2804617 RepID=UPI00260C2D24|nr:YaiO family outer membrane beta-barrel protein [Sphingomonas sp. LHG3406-1]